MPEFEPRELAYLVETGRIGIPELQREFVWKDSQVVDLADSIYHGYPIGLIILYDLPDELRSKIGAEYWVIDGQQRLMSIALMFYERVRVRQGYRELSIWFNPISEEFTSTDPLKRPSKPGPWVKLSEILQIPDEKTLSAYIEQRPEEERPNLIRLWLSFKRKIPVHVVEKSKTLEELGDIFTRINYAGTRIKGSDVYSTMLAVIAPGQVHELREFTDDLKTRWGLGYEWDLDYSTIIRTFVAFLTDGRVRLASKVLKQAERLKTELEKKRQRLKDIIQDVKRSVEEAINIMKDPALFEIVSSKYLPSEYVIITMAYYYYKRRSLSIRERKGIAFWSMLALNPLIRRYGYGAEWRLQRDLDIIKQGGSYMELIQEIEESQHIGDCRTYIKDYINYGYWNKLLIYTILKARKARDMRAGGSVLRIDDAYIHHIFPVSVLRGIYSEYEINDIGNITLVTHKTNKDIWNKKPAIYLQGVPDDILREHLIPSDPGLWDVRRYRNFIQERKRLLMEAIDEIWGEFVTL